LRTCKDQFDDRRRRSEGPASDSVGMPFRGMAVAFAVAVGVAVLADPSIRSSGRANLSAQWTAPAGVSALDFNHRIEGPTLPVELPRYVVFALPGLVVVALVTVLVSHRRVHALRTSRVGGLYGP
jgi:hypothetical protein